MLGSADVHVENACAVADACDGPRAHRVRRRAGTPAASPRSRRGPADASVRRGRTDSTPRAAGRHAARARARSVLIRDDTGGANRPESVAAAAPAGGPARTAAAGSRTAG